MFEKVNCDIRRYIVTEDVHTTRQMIDMLFESSSLWVVLNYRFGSWVRKECKYILIQPLLKIITKLIHKALELLTGIQVPFETEIGRGLYIGHIGTLVINSRARIGSFCNIGTGVVIGEGGRGANKGCPEIGDYVFIGVGAKIIGKIKVGNKSAIGANAVVTKDVPESTTVAGIPAKIINNIGSKDFIRI